MLFFIIFSPFCFGNSVWFWVWEGLTAETLACFLQDERLDFHCKLSPWVLLLQTLQRHIFWYLHSHINIATFLLLLKEWLLSEYMFLPATVPLATQSSSLSRDLSHPKLPSPKLLLHRQIILPLCTATPALWLIMVISCCTESSRGGSYQ